MYVKKINQFLSSIKKMRARKNWFLFSASRCRFTASSRATCSDIEIGDKHDGRGTLGILLFIAGRGRKAYWKRGVGGEGEGAEPIQ